MNTGIFKLLLWLLLLISGSAHAIDSRVLVIYPAAQHPVRTLYTSTLQGIKHKISSLSLIEIPEDADFANLQTELERQRPDKVIALGNQAAKFLDKSSYRTRALAGLLYFNPAEYNGVSLALDSQALLPFLQLLTPSIKRVFIVQNRHRRSIANAPSRPASTPSIIVREGDNLLANMRLLGQVLEQEATATDAILIPADIPNDILYEVSKMAWDKKIMLLSTNLAHLEYGAMLVFYPNMIALGEQLGDLVNLNAASYETVKTVDISLNQRVAQHLGIEFSPSLLSLFSIIRQ